MMPADVRVAAHLRAELMELLRDEGLPGKLTGDELWQRLRDRVDQATFGVVLVVGARVLANEAARHVWRTLCAGAPEIESPLPEATCVFVEADGRRETLAAWSFAHMHRGLDLDSVLAAFNTPGEVVLSAPDGSRRLMLATSSPLRFDGEGHPTATFCVLSELSAETEAKRAARAVHRRAAFLVKASTSLLSGMLDPDEMVKQLARLAVPAIADGCIIDVLDEQRGDEHALRRVATEYADPKKTAILKEVEARYSPLVDENAGALRVVRTGRSELHSLISKSALRWAAQTPEHLALLEALDPRSVVLVPLLGRGRAIGVVSLIRGGPATDAFVAEDLDMAEQLGLNAGLAVENARLFRYEQKARKAVEQAAMRVDRLQAMMTDLSSALTSADVFKAAVNHGLLALGGALGAVWTLDEARGVLSLAHASFPWVENGLERFTDIALDRRTAVGESAITRRTIFLGSGDEVRRKYPDADYDIEAVVVMPLVVQGNVKGVLAFTFEQPRTFEVDERAFVELVAAHCAQGLYRAHVYEAEQRARAEMSLLYTLVDTVNRATSMDDICNASLDAVTRALDVDRVAISLDDEDFAPRFVASRGLSRAYLAAVDGHEMWVGDRHKPDIVSVPDAARLPQFQPILERVRAEHIRAIGFFPLIHHGEFFGKIVVYPREGRLLSDDDLRLAQTIAGQLAQAVVRKRSEVELEGAREAAEHANRMKDEFLAVVSHELRTPLSSITGWVSILQSAKKDDPTTRARGLAAIARNAKAQATIIEDILDVSRIIRGKLVLDARPVAFVPLVGEAIDALRTSANAKQIDVELTAADDPFAIVGDPERIRQVAWNLISNAIKFTPPGGHVTVRVRRDADAVVLEVEDTGRGVAPDLLPFVFDRFRQADSSTTRREGGLGLGLSIVRHLVELHGGQVGAKSEGIGKGSTFFVTFPVRAIAESPAADTGAEDAMARGATAAPRPPSVSEDQRANLDGVRVLVVDDQADAREMLSEALSAYGAVVTVAGSAREAVAALEGAPQEIVVTDIGMPDEDGYALLKRIRALPGPLHDVPAIALTAYARAEDAKQAVQAGFQCHVAKPTRPELLAHVIAKAVGREAAPLPS